MLALLPDSIGVFCYTYLLLRDGSDAESVQQKINAALDGMELEDFSDPQASLMPLTDIHLRSCNLRELDVNGNIVYIWLVTGANVLLLIVVLFNLWFNSTLIFSYNSGMYRLLRLHGAPVNVILRTEALQGLAMALAATAAGLLLTAYISGTGAVQGEMPPWAVCMVCMAFISVVVAVSVVPAAGGMSMTYFLDGQFSGTQLRFSYKNVHKINGATSCGIVGMLNSEFIRSIAVAFVAAAPAFTSGSGDSHTASALTGGSLPEPESSSWSFRCCRYRSRAGMQQEPIRPTVSENSIQQMPDCSHRMIQQHPRPRPPHDGPDALPHVGTVAVDRASAACGLIV